MTKTKEEYKDGLDKILTKRFNRNIPQTKEELAFKMTEEGFRRKRIEQKNGTSFIDDQYPVSQKQVDYAWDFLHNVIKKGKQTRITEPRFDFLVESFKTRALGSFTYNNKIYRKGQYVPKGVRD